MSRREAARATHILVADDRAEVRSAIRLLLEHQDGLRVVGEAADVEQMVHALKVTAPDVVLLDWELPGVSPDGCSAKGSTRLISTMRGLVRGLGVVAMSGAPEARAEAEASGADAFVCKSDPPERLTAALAELAKGSV